MDSERLELLRRKKLHRKSDAIIRTNTLWAAGTGFIPIPVLDSAAIVAVQLKMLGELSSIHNVPFTETSGKSVIASFVASLTSNVLAKSLLATGLFSNVARALPVVGSTLSILTMPGFNAAFTYALGKVFQQHYESGGTIDDLDPKAAAPYFKEKFKESFKFGQKAEAV